MPFTGTSHSERFLPPLLRSSNTFINCLMFINCFMFVNCFTLIHSVIVFMLRIKIWQLWNLAGSKQSAQKIPHFSSVNFSSRVAIIEMTENLPFPHSWRNCWNKKYWQHITLLLIANILERDSRTTKAAVKANVALAMLGNCWSRWSSRSGKQEQVQDSLTITWWCSLSERNTGSSQLFPPPSSPHITPYHIKPLE